MFGKRERVCSHQQSCSLKTMGYSFKKIAIWTSKKQERFPNRWSCVHCPKIHQYITSSETTVSLVFFSAPQYKRYGSKNHDKERISYRKGNRNSKNKTSTTWVSNSDNPILAWLLRLSMDIFLRPKGLGNAFWLGEVCEGIIQRSCHKACKMKLSSCQCNTKHDNISATALSS